MRFLKVVMIILVGFILTALLCSCGSADSTGEITTTVEEVYMYRTEALLSIVPMPKEESLMTSEAGYAVYRIKEAIVSEDAAFDVYVQTFIDYAQKLNDVTLTRESGGVVLRRDSSLEAGQYRIVCSGAGVSVSASDNDGITYALATLHQIFEYNDGVLTVPAYTVTDKPDASYRALMVDLARKWHAVKQVKDYIDLCYLYKIKYIHLHFTDREGYTLPSDAFPELSSRYHYSKKDIADINRYALERNIEIIPEIDLPGHAKCITAAYPELFAHTSSDGNVDNDVLCLGKNGLMDNLKTIIEEIIEMFPNSRYIHVGGDEANFSTCEQCVDCKSFMADNGIRDTDGLYIRFVKDITDMVLSLGKTPVVWEGFPKEGADVISRDIVVTAWESLYHLPNDLVAEGFTVTNSSWLPLYIVPPTHAYVENGRWQPEDILGWNIYTWRNWWSQSAAYQKPIVIAPTDQVIGGTLCAWECNYLQDILPIKENLAALSERLWNVNGTIDVVEYRKALEKLWAMADRVLGDG